MGTTKGVNGWEDGLPVGGVDGYIGPALPESWEIVAAADLRDRAYEFSTVCVWRERLLGMLFGAADSGCSCPTPFSGLTPAGCKPIREVPDLDSLIDYVEEKPWSDDPDYDKERFQQIAARKADLLAKVHRALRDARLGKSPWGGYKTEG